MSHPPRRAALGFIFVTVLLDMLALGIIVPVLPTLVMGFMHGDAARSAEMIGLFTTVWALMQFLFSPVSASSPTATGDGASSSSRTSGLGWTTW